jgi:spermidine synthase/Flp pilus assembly protein TadD
VIAAAVLLPAAVLLGAIFPLAARVAHRAGESGGRAIGRAYAANTAGTVAGAALAGLFVLPALGSLRTLEAAAWTHVALGVALALVAPGAIALRAGIAVAIAALAITVRAVTPAPDLYRLNYGLVSLLRDIDRGAGPPPSLAAQQSRQIDALRMLSVEEGRTSTVAVVSRWEQRQLVINGKVDASSGDPTQTLLGQIPMILADRPKHGLVIGYGSGITTHSVLTHPIESVETIEIEPAVVRAGRWFADLNGWSPSLAHGGAGADPRGVVRFEDGRTHLTYSRRLYDVIVSEPSNPWIAGINNLFTAEFYDVLRAHLAGDGVFCQWLHGYDMTRETLASLFGTLKRAFPGAEVYRQNLDFLVVWRQSGAFFTRARLERAFEAPAVAADLARIGFTHPSDLLALYQGPIDAVAPEDGRLNTDDDGFVEFRAPIDVLRRGGANAWNTPPLAALALERYDPRMPRAQVLALWAEGNARRRDTERMAEVADVLAASGAAGASAALRRDVDRLAAERRVRPTASRLMIQAANATETRDVARAETLLREALALAPDDPDLLFRYGQAAAELGDLAGADRALRAALEQRQQQLVWHVGVGEPYQAELLLGILASGRGDFDQAITWFARARDRNPCLGGAHYLLAATYEVMGRRDEARHEAIAGLAIDPEDPKLRELNARLLAAK